MSAAKYSWTRNYSVDPQIAGEWIEGLPERTADAIVKASRSKSSPLHTVFNWDDTEAAREYRLIQARVLVSSLRVEIVSADRRPENVMAFIGSSDRVGYVPTMQATAEDLTAAELQCWRAMTSFKDRYKHLQMARTVIEAIAEVDRGVRRKKRVA